MLYLAALGTCFRAAVATLAAAALVFAVLSQSLAAAAHLDGHAIHHGYHHHDHDHDGAGQNDLDSHNGVAPPHCHFFISIPSIEILSAAVGCPALQAVEPPEILQAYFALFERPPKDVVL